MKKVRIPLKPLLSVTPAVWLRKRFKKRFENSTPPVKQHPQESSTSLNSLEVVRLQIFFLLLNVCR